MNTKNMSIQRTDSGFSVVYCGNVISRADVNCNMGMIWFSFINGQVITVDVSEFVEISKAYNLQFGITLTDDGMRFFVQSWELGLFCFETKTGKLLWRNKQKKAFQLATHGNVVLCRYSGKCISAIDIETGSVIRSYPLTSGTTFNPLSPDYYLVGPKRGYYEILDNSLDKQAKVPIAKLNPYAKDTFIIQEASLTENGLAVTGVEYTTTEFLAAVKSKQASDFIENSKFVRRIPVCISKPCI